MSQFFQQLVNGLVLGSTYGLIAVGYTMVYGIIQLINFAHGDIFMVGGFGALATWTGLGAPTGGALVAALPLMLLVAVITSVVVALAMERFAYRPLRHAPRLAPLITAIGVSQVLEETVRLRYPGATAPLVFPGLPGGEVKVGGAIISPAAILTVGVAVVCMVGLGLFVARTRSGRAMQAVAQDPDTAQLMGINVNRMIVLAFTIGAALAAVAGLMWGLRLNSVSFDMGFATGIKAFTAAVLGGIGNIYGAMTGGVVLGLVEVMATAYIPGRFGGGAWDNVWAFIVLIVVLLFRPQGILGERVADRA